MKPGIKFIINLIIWIQLLIFITPVLAYSVPEYDGYINDFAGVISESTENKLESRVQNEAARENGVEIAVATVSSLDGENIESVSQQFFDKWKIGKNNADNGVLMLLSINDREVRISTGYGAEVFLTDSTAGTIIRNDMAPFLIKNDYDQAVSVGVEKIIDRAGKIDQAEITRKYQAQDDLFGIIKDSPGLVVFFGVLLSYLFSFLGRSTNWWVGGVIGAIFGMIVSGLQGAAIFGFVGLILDYVLSKNYRKWNLEHKTTSWRRTWGGFYSGKPPVTFGGGRSGGGGASGKW